MPLNLGYKNQVWTVYAKKKKKLTIPGLTICTVRIVRLYV